MKESILWPILQQARSHATNGFNFDVDKFHNKFAELIVRECAITVIDRCEMRSAEDVKRAEYHANRIKQHFGVEEQTASQKMADAGYTRRPKGWTKEDEE